MIPASPRGEALKKRIRQPMWVSAAKRLDADFVELRAEADAWHAKRDAFMNERLEQGRHPDTDPHFWDGYAERPAPELPATIKPPAPRWHQTRDLAGVVAVLAVPSFLVVWLVGRTVRARRKPARPAEW